MSMVYKASRMAMAAAKAQQPSRPAMAAAKVAAAGGSDTKVSKRGGGALTAPLPISPELKKFVGVSEIARGEALKKVWEHIKTNNLQSV